MIYEFIRNFIDIVMGDSHIYNTYLSYVVGSLFPLIIIYTLLIPVFGKASSRFIFYVILIFICLLIITLNGGDILGM